MPSQESISEELRARTEFTAAVRTGVEALVTRCGYSRERAILALLKEINRGTDGSGKPTDDEVFKTMRRHKLGIDEANRAIIVSRAMKRELCSRKGRGFGNAKESALEAVQSLISKISLDTILYESGEDESDEDEQNNEIIPLKIPSINRATSSSSTFPTTSAAVTSNSKNTNTCTNINVTTAHSTSSSTSRKTARGKKLTSPSPRKQQKNIRKSINNSHNNGVASIHNNGSGSNVTASTKLVGRKRAMDEIDPTSGAANAEAKASNGRPTIRASKRVHRASSANNNGSNSNSSSSANSIISENDGEN